MSVGEPQSAPATTSARILRAATRSSPLAKWQAEHIAALITQTSGVSVEFVYVDTLGDRTQALGTPLHNLGGQGVFVKEVQAAVLRGEADFAVHSAKDLPSTTADGLLIGAIPERGEVRDVLIGHTIDSLPPGATVGTSSVRRATQLLNKRPDLQIRPIRGNVGTRIGRVGELDAIVLAAAPLSRLGIEVDLRSKHVVELLEPATMLPMIGQGAIAVECRSADDFAIDALRQITHLGAAIELECERAYLRELGGGCDLPVAALARLDGLSLSVDGLVASLDGQTIVRHLLTAELSGDQQAALSRARELGRELAVHIARSGGADLLAAGKPSQAS